MSATTGLTGPPQPPPKTVRQEVAPRGGYAPINVARNVPKSIGGSAGLLLVGTAAMMSYGFYRVGTFNVKRRFVPGKFQNRTIAAQASVLPLCSRLCANFLYLTDASLIINDAGTWFQDVETGKERNSTSDHSAVAG